MEQQHLIVKDDSKIIVRTTKTIESRSARNVTQTWKRLDIPTKPNPTQSNPTQPNPIQSNQIQPNPTQPNPTQSNPVLWAPLQISKLVSTVLGRSWDRPGTVLGPSWDGVLGRSWDGPGTVLGRSWGGRSWGGRSWDGTRMLKVSHNLFRFLFFKFG